MVHPNPWQRNATRKERRRESAYEMQATGVSGPLTIKVSEERPDDTSPMSPVEGFDRCPADMANATLCY